MTPSLEDNVITQLGEEGLRVLVRAFYARIPGDSLLRPMYPEEDLGPAEERLFDFLVFRFGGSHRYVEERGHPRLRMRHASFPVDEEARDAWMDNMQAALEETVEDQELRDSMSDFLGQVATFLINREG